MEKMAEILAASIHDDTAEIPWPHLSPETKRRKIQACLPYVRAVDPRKTVAENAVLLVDVARAHQTGGLVAGLARETAGGLAWTVLCLYGTPRI
jgi:hypothetical protein